MKATRISIKRKIKIGITVLCTLLIINMFYGACQATSSMDLGTIKNQADSFINQGKEGETITQREAVKNLIPVGRVLVQVATIVLVIVGLIMGLKYMMSGADEKAKMKEKLIWYVISIVLVYGAVGIFNIVVNVINNVLE